MMTRRSAAVSRVSVRPTEIASVAELIRRPPLDFNAAKQDLGGPKQDCLFTAATRGLKVCKNSRLSSTSTQNFSNARDSDLFSPLVPPLLLPDQLRNCPEGGRELRGRFVPGPGKRYWNDFLYGSGAISHDHHPVRQQKRFFDAVRHER